MDMISCEFPDGAKAHLRHLGTDMLITNEHDQILLIKRSPQVSRSNKYALPGGYLDRDEDTHLGALREVEEETGYIAEISFLFCINNQTDHHLRKDNRQNVLLVFAGKVVGGNQKLNDEVTEIIWVSESELPDEEDFAFDHRKIIQKFFAYKKSKFVLPLFAKDIQSS